MDLEIDQFSKGLVQLQHVQRLHEQREWLIEQIAIYSNRLGVTHNPGVEYADESMGENPASMALEIVTLRYMEIVELIKSKEIEYGAE